MLHIILLVVIAVCHECSCYYTRDDLPVNVRQLLLNNLKFTIGKVPFNDKKGTRTHGLYTSSNPGNPPTTKTGLNGLSLAALPGAVNEGLISFEDAQKIADETYGVLEGMFSRSADAKTMEDGGKYGILGILPQSVNWNEQDQLWYGKPMSGVSPIGTALLSHGLIISGVYFGRTDKVTAMLKKIDWYNWMTRNGTGLDPHYQVPQGWNEEKGFSAFTKGHYSHELLNIILAAILGNNIDRRKLWDSFEREYRDYREFKHVLATQLGNTIKDFAATMFFDFQCLGDDFNGLNIYEQSAKGYKAHVEYFRVERGFKDYLTRSVYKYDKAKYGNKITAKPNLKKKDPYPHTDATFFTTAGGLSYYDPDPTKNPLIASLNKTAVVGSGIDPSTGFNVGLIEAQTDDHKAVPDTKIKQSILNVALAIEGYLNRLPQRLMMTYQPMRTALDEIFPNENCPGWNSTASR